MVMLWINNYFWLVTSLKRFLNEWKCLELIVSFGWEESNPKRNVCICILRRAAAAFCSLGA